MAESAVSSAVSAVGAAAGVDLLALAGAWWKRECAARGAERDDPQVAIAGLGRPAPQDLIAGAPYGPRGVAWLGEIHLRGLTGAERLAEGRYYTPAVLASRLVERTLAHAPRALAGGVVDPACGAGALLLPIVERVVAERSPSDAMTWVAERLRATDLDPVAVVLANMAVASALLPAWRAIPEARRPALPQPAIVWDGLLDDLPASLVITNPPFGRVRLSTAERQRFSRALFGHANRATLFLDNALARLADPGSAAAFVLPASLVGGAYSQRIRRLLAEEAPPAWLGFVVERGGVFPGQPQQEALLGVFVKGRAAAPIAAERITLNGGIAHRRLPATPPPARPGEPWLVPRRAGDARLLENAAQRLTARLPDVGWKVSTGPLVWNRHRDQLHDGGAPGRLPVIWAGDVQGGVLSLREDQRRRWLEPTPSQEWLVLDRPAILVQRTTAPEQPRRLVAALLDAETLHLLGGRVVVENHVNVCTWSGAGAVTPRRLLRFLGSSTADRLYRCMTGSVAVSAFELHALPLPSPEEWRAGRFPGR